MPLRAPLVRRRLARLRRGFLALGLSLAAAMAARGQESASEFFAENPTLRFLEQRMDGRATVAVPAPFEKHAATDLELADALGGVLDEFLAPPATLADKLPALFVELCRLRPAQTVAWTRLVAERLLQHRPPQLAAELEQIIGLAAGADPALAGPAAAEMVRAIRQALADPQRPLDPVVASELTRAVLRVAIFKVPEPRGRLGGIISAAFVGAGVGESLEFVSPCTAACVENARALDKTVTGAVVRGVLTGFGKSRELAGLLCVGALRGTGVEVANTVKDEAALALPVPFAAFTTTVCNAFVSMKGAAGSPEIIGRLIAFSNSDLAPAVVLGAAGAFPESAPAFVEAALNRDLALRGRASTRDMVEAGILAAPDRAVEIVRRAVGRGDESEGPLPAQVAEAIGRAAPRRLLAAALRAQLAAETPGRATTRGIVAGALAGVTFSQRLDLVPHVAFVVASASGSPGLVVEQGLASVPPEEQHAVVLGALAADPARAPALLEKLLAAGVLASSQVDLVNVAGPLVLRMQREPTAFFRALAELPLPADSRTWRAALLAATLANPRGSTAAGAVVAARSHLPLGELVKIAAAWDPARERAVEAAAAIARRIAGEPAALARLLPRALAVGSAGDSLAAALAAAPDRAVIIAGLAGRTAPGEATAIVPRLFAFSPATSPDSLAALAEAFVAGIAEAQLDRESAAAAIDAAADAAIKSTFALAGPGRPLDTPAARDAALAAVVAGLCRAAPEQGIATTRAAARAARSLAGTNLDPAALVRPAARILGALQSARVNDAVASGFADADAQVPAATVRRLFDHTRDPLTGVPLTRLLDL